MSETVKVEGLADLDRAMAELSVSIQRRILREVGTAALEPMDRAWRSLAPFDPAAENTDEDGRPYVHLRDSGGVGSKLSRRQQKRHRKRDDVEIHAGPGPHSKAVQAEFGNSRHAAEPYMRPAWDQTRGEVLDKVKTGLADKVEAARVRAARRQARLIAKNRGG